MSQNPEEVQKLQMADLCLSEVQVNTMLFLHVFLESLNIVVRYLCREAYLPPKASLAKV